ncbi:sphingoid long-chain bases kinase 1 isoform X2 [Tripterygium wilfordii]|uniref:Sphingoid long-chain bases kinase 1 isoform X2 n=1 Tax=Tripterygium wilfordii TaxID=458696 RepID=A0A7J7DMD1_TRIWF|nr:sphingoid long-chain bases kinase 1 isoform X2 [Tripterygium wilfordii]
MDKNMETKHGIQTKQVHRIRSATEKSWRKTRGDFRGESSDEAMMKLAASLEKKGEDSRMKESWRGRSLGETSSKSIGASAVVPSGRLKNELDCEMYSLGCHEAKTKGTQPFKGRSGLSGTDPVTAALAIIKGGLVTTDVFAVEWIQTGVIHYGMTVNYYGFISDVLELSEKYQKRYGPLRYFVAGFLKFLCLPKYSYEVEYLPASKDEQEGNHEIVDIAELYTDVMTKSNTEGIPRASSLSSIDSIMTPSRMSGGDFETCSSTYASTEPSEYVRGLDPKSKRLSSGRSNVTAEPEVIHPQLPLSTTPNWPRTRSKSRTDKGWTGLTSTHDSSRCSWGNAATNDREDISSTLSDPGPIWDTEPKWDSEPNWDVENPIELPGPPGDAEAGAKKEIAPRNEEKWVVKKGQFLGIMVCNHACRTVQSAQVVAPKAEHDDYTMDMIFVHGNGRLRLLRFFLLLQIGRHLSLPYAEYVKVKSVKIKPGKHTHNGCGIDGELFPLNGQVISYLLPEQCRLIGRSPSHHV